MRLLRLLRDVGPALIITVLAFAPLVYFAGLTYLLWMLGLAGLMALFAAPFFVGAQMHDAATKRAEQAERALDAAEERERNR